MFDPKRVAVVDHVDSSILIRGNMPLLDGHYPYQEIGKAAGVDLSTYSQYISISLIDNTGERDIWAQELAAFGVDPNIFLAKDWPPYVHIPGWNPGKKLGSALRSGGLSIPASLIWWPIEGLAANAGSEPFLKSPGWDLTGLVQRVIALLREPKTAIYFHCMLGADRTGALHASYLVTPTEHYYAKTIDEALNITSKATAAGAPTMDYQRLARAYAANFAGQT